MSKTTGTVVAGVTNRDQRLVAYRNASGNRGVTGRLAKVAKHQLNVQRCFWRKTSKTGVDTGVDTDMQIRTQNQKVQNVTGQGMMQSKPKKR